MDCTSKRRKGSVLYLAHSIYLGWVTLAKILAVTVALAFSLTLAFALAQSVDF